MECPRCHSRLTFREVAGQRCPCCNIKVYLSDRCWGWLRGLASLGLAIVVTFYWFPSQIELLQLLFWFTILCAVFIVLLIGSMFVFHPDVDLVPPRRPDTTRHLVVMESITLEIPLCRLKRVIAWVATIDYCCFAYSALASLRMGMSGSASFQKVRKS